MDPIAAPIDTRVDEPFESFYAREYAWAVRLAFGLTGEGAVAEEIAQDAFIRMRDRFAAIDHPRSYLRASLVNGATSHRRRKVVERRYQTVDSDEWVPSHLFELRDALKALPPKQRAAIVMRYLEDLDDDEIALALSCRQATVRSLVHRGLNTFRKGLDL